MQLQTNIPEIQNTDLKYVLLDYFKKEVNLLLLDGNTSKGDAFEWVIAAGSMDEISVGEHGAFEALQAFHEKHKDWVFGSLSYDLKNGLERLNSENSDGIQAPALHFFLPKYLFYYKDNQLFIYHHKEQKEFPVERLFSTFSPSDIGFNSVLKPMVSKANYIENVNQIKEHIQRGDIYEMNYCQEFYAEQIKLNPELVFADINKEMSTPFSAFLKLEKQYVLSASPERYIKKSGRKIISQPIKGTRKRGGSTTEDLKLIEDLLKSEKDISENIMIIDLVRNDLSITASKASVKVNELCKIYTFEKVHQMISTISSKISEDIHFADVLSTTFPMGSMTGAPKLKAAPLVGVAPPLKGL